MATWGGIATNAPRYATTGQGSPRETGNMATIQSLGGQTRTPAAAPATNYMTPIYQQLGVPAPAPRATAPAATTPTVGAGTTYAQQVGARTGLTTGGGGTTPQAAVRTPAAAAPAGGGGQTWGGWGTAVQQGGGFTNVTGTPTWASWQTSAPLYSTTNYINPQTGRNWGTTPRLNMALAEATGYTGNFDAASWNAYYNSLPANKKAEADAIRASYPANTAATGGGAATTTGGAAAGAAPVVAGTNVPQGGTTPALVSGGAGVTATGPGGAGPGTAGGVGGSWIRQGAAPTGIGLPAGVTTVMPTFASPSGDLTGYSNTAANWGNQANMAAYYPTR